MRVLLVYLLLMGSAQACEVFTNYERESDKWERVYVKVYQGSCEPYRDCYIDEWWFLYLLHQWIEVNALYYDIKSAIQNNPKGVYKCLTPYSVKKRKARRN